MKNRCSIKVKTALVLLTLLLASCATGPGSSRSSPIELTYGDRYTHTQPTLGWSNECWYSIRSVGGGSLDIDIGPYGRRVDIQAYNENNNRIAYGTNVNSLRIDTQAGRTYFFRVIGGDYTIQAQTRQAQAEQREIDPRTDPAVLQAQQEEARRQQQLAQQLAQQQEEEAARWAAAARAAGMTVVEGNSLQEKLDWLEAFARSNTSYYIAVTTNEERGSVDFSYSGRSGISITLRGVGANPTAFSGEFTVGSGNTLVLENNINLINIRNGGISVRSRGTLIMNNGTTVERVSVGSGATFTMNGGTISTRGNGGVSVYNNATFTMNGGTITGIEYNGSGGPTAYVSVDSDGGGGGVRVYGGTFNMTGGAISGNTASRNGGAVWVGNYRSDGVTYQGIFTMTGGTISGNATETTYRSSGGGVYVSDGTFTMRGGTISGNTARENGGGVYVSGAGTFTKTGGTIYGYSASDIANSNAVMAGRTATNFRGHAVYASASGSPNFKIREGTAGPGVNLSCDSGAHEFPGAVPQKADGAWDN